MKNKKAYNIALPIFGQDQHSSGHFISTDHLLFWGLTSIKYPNIGNAERYTRHMGGSILKTITLPMTFGILLSSCTCTATAKLHFFD